MPRTRRQIDRPDKYPPAMTAVRRLAQCPNAKHMEKFPGDADLVARIASYELAGKMQCPCPM